MAIINPVIKGKQPVIDTLSVTPTTSAQTITAPSGTDGYSPVNVSAVTSSIDANIVAGNIKKDVQILGVTGSYEGINPTGTKSITANGVYDVTNYASADVQVPTTAPSYYLEFPSSSGTINDGRTVLLNLQGITTIGQNAFKQLYYGTNISGNIDLSGIVEILADGCSNMFYTCSHIQNVDMSNVVQVGNNACAYMIANSSATSLDLSSLETVGSYGLSYMANRSQIQTVSLGNVKTIGSYGLQDAFSYCSSLTSAVDLSKVTSVAQNGLMNAFRRSAITGIADLSSLVIASSSGMMNSAFSQCSALGGIRLSSLVVVYGGSYDYVMGNVCSASPNVSYADLSSLKYIAGTSSVSSIFTGTSLTSLSFPALTYAAALENIIYNVNGCTLHFPANLDPQTGSTVISGLAGYPNFGGVNTVVAFDLPSTFILTGANSVEYERNPKYDTATALGWRVKDTGTMPNIVVDFTPFYTSGTTDPQVSDTIYSDAACTTPVTTISAIA